MNGVIARCSYFGGRAGLAATLRTNSSISEGLRRELTLRRLPLAFDYLHPQPSHLLDLTLRGVLPDPQPLSEDDVALPSVNSNRFLPAGHHLVYFPPQVALSQLLPDGTDALHSPGEPFGRRLWAGGKVRFPAASELVLDGSRAVCIETIRDVIVKGRQGEEKVVVKIERRVATVQEDEKESSIRERIWKEDEDNVGQSSIIENRDLVFMRKKTREQLDHDRAKFEEEPRFITYPEFRHKIKPSRALLFRFSALTFNAHAIHLDEAYTRNVEGFRSLLVHGPLTLALLLTALHAHLIKYNRNIREIEYKNLAPLYAEESLSICGKPKTSKYNAAWDVWIENKNGGLAVRGVVQTDPL
ncbi:hypothetical protein EYZ11_012667 [Aspergillus tanneri]|uniref:Uncharacterized protein n=1 Tax=Aspergillus tanneri TaxID=1220188 RepID=A0A4S3IZW5_9EURO|nr:hypothetical protein EYZ11_012667 [Aspergillus tanneri]